MTTTSDTSLFPFRFYSPVEVLFGTGSFRALEERRAALGDRALVVTGKRSARATGTLDRALAQLPGAAVFDDVEENPGTGTCDRAADLCRASECDFVVAIGGGSAIDVGKAAAGLARNPGPASQYFGADKFRNGSLPLVAVPTTAGAGSEVTPGAVIVDSENKVKRTISGRTVFADLALLDPELTVPLPRDVTVNTGLDALSQAMEGMASKKATPIGDLLALEVCRLVKEYLGRAAADGRDIEARTAMLYASTLAGMVIAQSGTTLVHGMGYYFTLEFGVPHGLANALLLTPLFRHNAQYVPAKVAAMADALGVPAEAMSADAGEKISVALHSLLEELGVSPAAKAAGVEPERLDEFARGIMNDPYRFRNQVGEITEERVTRYFRQACEGAA
jgi:alcohol dehydrogenase class IV